jgi:hypothetical protein
MSNAMLSFDAALKESEAYSRRHALLGNGFSIACRPDIFVYGRLFERADFSKLSESARRSFDALETQDFERVIKALRDASSLAAVYEEANPKLAAQLKADADGLKEVLVNTVADSHPEHPNELTEKEYAACRRFLDHFDTIYTMNYDLLLYWAQMHTKQGQDPSSDDGFRKSEDDYESAYVVWESHQSHGQNCWFLHGALHVFDSGTQIQKYTWINTGIRLIEQIRDALSRDLYPLFVAEGTSEEKLTRIKHSDYLAKAYRSFSEIKGCLFIYGHSLADNDAHFLKRIEKGKLQHIFVGVYGSPKSNENKRIIARANAMVNARPPSKPLRVSFYDAVSANVWC